MEIDFAAQLFLRPLEFLIVLILINRTQVNVTSHRTRQP
jgi:hypothetical protein